MCVKLHSVCVKLHTVCEITQCAQNYTYSIGKNSSQLKSFTLTPLAALASNISCAPSPRLRRYALPPQVVVMEYAFKRIHFLSQRRRSCDKANLFYSTPPPHPGALAPTLVAPVPHRDAWMVRVPLELVIQLRRLLRRAADRAPSELHVCVEQEPELVAGVEESVGLPDPAPPDSKRVHMSLNRALDEPPVRSRAHPSIKQLHGDLVATSRVDRGALQQRLS